MTIKVRATRMILAATMLVTALGAAAPARAECPVLSEGRNPVSQGCYYLDVPEGVDMLKLRGSRSDLWSPEGDWVCDFGYWGAQYCAVPGPDAGRMRVVIHVGSTLDVQFADATPVTGAGVGSMEAWGDAQMFRFVDLESAATISLASSEDVDLTVRRGAPPTLDESDCVSAQPSSRPLFPFANGGRGNLSAGTESCRLDAGAGPIYAFVTLRATTSVRLPCFYLLDYFSCLPPSPVGIGCWTYYRPVRCIEYPKGFAITGTTA